MAMSLSEFFVEGGQFWVIVSSQKGSILD